MSTTPHSAVIFERSLPKLVYIVETVVISALQSRLGSHSKFKLRNVGLLLLLLILLRLYYLCLVRKRDSFLHASTSVCLCCSVYPLFLYSTCVRKAESIYLSKGLFLGGGASKPHCSKYIRIASVVLLGCLLIISSFCVSLQL